MATDICSTCVEASHALMDRAVAVGEAPVDDILQLSTLTKEIMQQSGRSNARVSESRAQKLQSAADLGLVNLATGLGGDIVASLNMHKLEWTSVLWLTEPAALCRWPLQVGEHGKPTKLIAIVELERSGWKSGADLDSRWQVGSDRL